ncbi:MAG TPA: hypothetical protein VGE37_03705, partial [Archangium sp.]
MKQSAQACGPAGAECRACLPQQLCVSGTCLRDPDASVILDDGGNPVTDAGQQGTDAGTDAGMNCGARGQACCPGLTCFLTLTCQRGFCDIPGAVTDAGPGTDAGMTPDAGQPLRLT